MNTFKTPDGREFERPRNRTPYGMATMDLCRGVRVNLHFYEQALVQIEAMIGVKLVAGADVEQFLSEYRKYCINRSDFENGFGKYITTLHPEMFKADKKKRQRLPGPADEERAIELIEAAANLRATDEHHLKNLAELVTEAASEEANLHDYERAAAMLVKKGRFIHKSRGKHSGYYLSPESPTHVSEMLGDARKDPRVG